MTVHGIVARKTRELSFSAVGTPLIERLFFLFQPRTQGHAPMPMGRENVLEF